MQKVLDSAWVGMEWPIHWGVREFTCHGVPTDLVLIVRPACDPPAGRKKAEIYLLLNWSMLF